jgi:glutamate-ammonia-ligase adenylyltransferase
MVVRAAAEQTNWLLKPAAKLVPLDQNHARRELSEIASAAQEEGLPRLAKFLAGKDAVQDLLAAVFDLSPFLRDTVRRRPQILDALFDETVETRLITIGAAIDKAARAEAMSESSLMMELRQWKAEAHVLIALADLAGEAETAITVRRLSDLADACTRAAVDFLLRDAHGQGKVKLPDPEDPARRSGWILLGMGKLGAHELNFSSDIDLVVFFDPQAPAVVDPLDATELFSRLTRRLVRILQDRTEHGYVFRTDLRLRPDPGSTPLAIPVEAALRYYEARGQNWERAAMIKARPVAGDFAAGAAFLKDLQPYIWRKYMDYAAIADVHSIKRQIHAHKGLGEIAVKGHNVKLGRGGIREIEFFVQTQQLIAGGRFPELRGRETVPMLASLRHAAGSRPMRATRSPGNTGSCAASSMPSRWSPTSRSIYCQKMTKGSNALPACSVLPMRRSFPRRSAPHSIRSNATMQRFLRPRPSFRRASAIWSLPAMSMTPIRCRPCRDWASSGRATSAVLSEAGISAAIASPSQPRRASG